jgi:hypothetical protein
MQFAMGSIKEYQQSAKFWGDLAKVSRWGKVGQGLEGRAGFGVAEGFGKGTASSRAVKGSKKSGFSP